MNISIFAVVATISMYLKASRVSGSGLTRSSLGGTIATAVIGCLNPHKAVIAFVPYMSSPTLSSGRSNSPALAAAEEAEEENANADEEEEEEEAEESP